VKDKGKRDEGGNKKDGRGVKDKKEER